MNRSTASLLRLCLLLIISTLWILASAILAEHIRTSGESFCWPASTNHR